MSWYNEAIFYHIYPLGLSGAPKQNDYSTPVHRLNTLLPWIDHIKAIGCTALYIGPLFESVGHGYETTDYKKLDSRLGTNEDLTAFVKVCHEKGIKVIFDGVFNHTGRDFFAFKDIQKNREHSPYLNWYCNVNFYGNNEYNDGFSYDNWGGYNLLVKLNQRNPDVQNYICDVIRYWVSEFDVDGIRLDAADVLDFDFMRMLRRTAEEVKPDFWLMGEVIHGDYSRWANNDMLHSVTNYELHKGLYSGHNDHNYFEIAHTIKRLNGIVGDKKLYTFCDNHDVARIYSKLNNKAHMYNVAILVYTVPGIPSIYYGSEFGIPGNKENGSDWNLRPDLNLADFNEKDELPALYTTLGHLKQRFPELTYGDYRELYLTTGQFAFARCLDGRAVVTALNNADNGAHMEINLPIGANKAVNLLTIDQTTEVQEDTCTDDATAKAWENARNELLDKAGQLVGASGEIRYKAEDIRKALEALETGADFGQAVWNLFGNLNDTMNNMHRVIGEFEQTMHKQERNSVAAGGDCTGGESLEIRDGKLIVDLPANKGVVVYLTNE